MSFLSETTGRKFAPPRPPPQLHPLLVVFSSVEDISAIADFGNSLLWIAEPNFCK